ncbi:MAG: sigma-54-dependent Fis family transcriptional regulator [Deltaproteobacteria bacterium]|nr:sigma-54-dependent Fis family transcriptional regulator [Deltaproteobacteria bacterium]
MDKTAVRKPRVLVVDDGTTYAEVIAQRMPEVQLVAPGALGSQGRLEDGPNALEFLSGNRETVDVVLLDMRFDIEDDRLLELDENASDRKTRRFQGVAILREIRHRFPDLPVVLLTSYQDLSPVDAGGELAAQSMTYFLDGDDLDSLRIRINAAWQETSEELEESRVLWGDDPSMRTVRRRLAVLARGRLPAILEGETGTGKSFLAEHFVHASSGRTGPFVVCDLASVPTELIPAHLFGAVRGAYTGSVADRKGLFEMANGGTLFIDEIQNIPLDVQKQLLQVLQDHQVRPLGSARNIAVDVKVVAASNQPLDEAVASGRFRSDLYMRLSPATRVRIPPLVERMDDVEYLSVRFVQLALRDPDIEELAAQVTRAIGLKPEAQVKLVIGRPKQKSHGQCLEFLLPKPAWRMLCKHRWPGNTRELMNVMQNIVIFTLIAAQDAIRDGLPITSSRLQVDPGLVGELLAGSAMLSKTKYGGAVDETVSDGVIPVVIEQGQTLNAVSSSVERQYFLALYRMTEGDFGEMATRLLGDRTKSRAVRLRFNQLGLKVREIAKA